MRGINDHFLDDLLHGELAFFLRQVKEKRDKLSLEIRGGYINLYHRGGNLLQITQKKNGYRFHFDARYCLNKGDDSHYRQIAALNPSSTQDHIASFALLQSEMERWFAAHPKPEREYQHQLLLHNPAIVDIEYQVKNRLRLDMLMAMDDRLIVVENKYGLGAVSGSAGLAKHYRDICSVLTDDALREELYSSVEAIAACKHRLGLRDQRLKTLDREKHEILFLLADYNPKSRMLLNERGVIEASVPAGLLFTSADEYEIDCSKAVDWFAF